MYGLGPVPFNDGCAVASMDMSTEYRSDSAHQQASRSGIGQDRSSHAGSKAPKFVGETVPPDFKVRGWHSLEKVG